jgi:hypothetical protein
VHAKGLERFKHKITNIRQARMTLKCRGGILADDMGMGKSLTLLALVLHTLEEARKFGETLQNTMLERETRGVTRATLLIAPKSSTYLSSYSSPANAVLK